MINALGQFTQTSFLTNMGISGGKINLAQLTAGVVTIMISVGIISALIYIVWSGFRIATSSGDKTKLANARYKLIYAIVGLVVVAGAFVIWQLILNFIGANKIDPGFEPLGGG
jgi:tellurite resistance protein TehA-like permease